MEQTINIFMIVIYQLKLDLIYSFQDSFNQISVQNIQLFNYCLSLIFKIITQLINSDDELIIILQEKLKQREFEIRFEFKGNKKRSEILIDEFIP